MREKLASVFLAAALVGSAGCQRQSETPSSPPPASISASSASGEPRPQPNFQAAVQTTVESTVPISSQGDIIIPRVDTPHPPYNSDPPTSGWHVPYVAAWGEHLNPIPKELQVSNLKQGGVLIQYNCNNCPELVDRLRAITKRYFPSLGNILLAPYPNMKARIALTAWERLLPIDSANEQQIISFIEKNLGLATAQKPSGGEKVTIRLKPEELYQKLLTTPIQPNELPPEITVGRNVVLKLDPEDQALKAIGRVFIFVDDSKAPNQSGSGIMYTLFPNASLAKSSYDFHASLAKRMSANTLLLEDFGYPAFLNSFDLLYENTGAKCMVAVDNVLILSALNGPFDQTIQRKKTISLTKAAIAHLQKVGR